tara:strand:- start:305 stop:1738 length:1434 start_codon:yes stop_codon:yes gene_type:complete
MKNRNNANIKFLSCLFFFVVLSVTSQKQQKPNIVLILTDQHNAKALSSAGNKNLSTPNLDNLAKSGIRFENTYVTFPLCTPSRSSIFTGKRPHSLGVNSNQKSENKLNPTEKENVLGNLLSQAGYDCAYGGKWHAHEHSMVTGNGFEFIAPMGDIGLAEKSIEYIKSKKNAEKPFFLVVSFDNPHNICEWARNQPLPYGNVPKTSIENTPQLPENFVKANDFPEVLNWEQEANKTVYPTAHYSKEDWRQYLYAYYRLVEKVDTEIGKIIKTIEDENIRDNTLIIFTSDHGDGNASHGWNQKTFLYQEAAKVPFIVSYPNKIKKEKKANPVLISNGLDLYPTICDYAGVIIDSKLTGLSLRPIFEKKQKKLDRKFVVVETKFEGKQALGTLGRSVISTKYKYTLYSWGKNREQLFDLEKDPYERKNLRNSKDHLEVLDTYRTHLYQWCKETQDYTFLRKIILPSDSKVPSTELYATPW